MYIVNFEILVHKMFCVDRKSIVLFLPKPFCSFHQVKAQEVWSAIVESQIETGTPYMLYKDACNR